MEPIVAKKIENKQASAVVEEGEYVETFISQKVGHFDFNRRGKNFEEVLQVEVTKETLILAEQRIKSNLSQFVDTVEPEASQETQSITFDLQKYDQFFKEAIEATEMTPYNDQRLVRTQRSSEDQRALLAFEKLK